MKKIISLQCALLFIFLFSSFHSDAQKKISEGKATFNISFPETDLDQETLSMMPTETVIYFKNKMSRSEVKMAMGTTIGITNGEKGETTTLMDMMGQKIAMKLTKAEVEKERAKAGLEKPVVKLADDTKKIAGFNCKKAIVTIKDKEGKDITINIWYTKEITAPNSIRTGSSFDGVDGFLMEFETAMDQFTMKLTCKSVEETKVDDAMFTIPDGYTMTTMEELRNSRGKGGH